MNSPLAAASVALADAVPAATNSSALPPWLVIVLALLAAVGGVTGVIALLNLPKTRQRMDVDASQVITAAATTLVGPLTVRVTDLEGKVTHLEAEVEAWGVAAAEHAPWDAVAQHELKKLGIDIGPPPALRPRLGADVHVTVTTTGPQAAVTATSRDSSSQRR